MAGFESLDGSTMVEYLTNYCKINNLNPTIGTGREKVVKSWFYTWLCSGGIVAEL